MSQTDKAYSEMMAAHRELIEAMMSLQAISTMGGAQCACGNGQSCAYHAGLIHRTLESLKRIDLVLDELRADIAHPGRKV